MTNNLTDMIFDDIFYLKFEEEKNDLKISLGSQPFKPKKELEIYII